MNHFLDYLIKIINKETVNYKMAKTLFA